ncbi:MAG: alpha/beta hydrolase [candidate division Zixibacteria bacterium]|nr:alpha/beta hydrolase [candidate division Zixibacteria bacterium]
MKQHMLPIVIVIISCYVLICLGLYVFQDYLIFFPRKLVYRSHEVVTNKEHEIKITVDNVILHGWLLNKGKEKLIIYYGGNAEEVSANIQDMQAVKDCSVLLMNYRGYGMSEGKPGEKVMFSDALNVYDQITSELRVPPENIVLFGRSLGSGVAVYVASKRTVSKLILVTPFDSIRSVGQGRFLIFPVGLILKHPFDSMRHAKDISSSSLILMGGRDTIIPNDHSVNLANSWRGECKTVLIKQADHNDIHAYPEYWQAITEYLEQ